MHCRDSAWFFVVVVFTATIAAPTTPPQSVKWLQLANSQKFQQYNATLLNAEVMPFLSTTCYKPSCCKDDESYRCNLYFDAVAWAEEVHYNANVTKAIVAGIVTSSSNVTEFCLTLTTAIATVNSRFGHRFSNLTESLNSVSCTIGCGDLHTEKARQECSVSLWLLNEVANYQLAKAPVTPSTPNVKSAQPVSVSNAEQVAQKPPEEKEVVLSDAKSENAAFEYPIVADEQENPLIPNTKSNVEPPHNPAAPQKEETEKQGDNTPNVKEEKNTDTHPDIKSTTKGNATPVQSTEPKNEPKPGPPTAANKAAEPTPTVAGKITTEASPAKIPEEDDEYPDQMDESNEQENSMFKEGSPDISQSPKIENRNPIYSREDQDTVIVDRFKEEPSSNFFYYFLFGMFACILAYVIYNNKSKILALLLEGRRAQSGRGGRRKHTAAYRKLDSNLEEAIMSTAPSGHTSQIIY